MVTVDSHETLLQLNTFIWQTYSQLIAEEVSREPGPKGPCSYINEFGFYHDNAGGGSEGTLCIPLSVVVQTVPCI